MRTRQKPSVVKTQTPTLKYRTYFPRIDATLCHKLANGDLEEEQRDASNDHK